MVRIRVHAPRVVQALRRAQYVVVTVKGVKFVEQWYTADHIPSHLTSLYQFLLRLIWMEGTMIVPHSQRRGYTQVVNYASANGYVKIQKRSMQPQMTIQQKIREMIGDAPGWIYA